MEERKSRYELFLEEEARKAQPSKQCTKCGEIKMLSEFHRESRRKSGTTARCKKCVNNAAAKYKSRLDMFWKRFHSRTQNQGECVEWTGAYNHKNKSPICRMDGRKEPVRRVVYKLAIGDLPDDMFIAMTCRNPRCVRHSHMERVTIEEKELIRLNSIISGDKHSSHLHPERRPRGEKHPHSKLTDSDVREIRKLFLSGAPKRALARDFGVARTSIKGILSGELWKHVQ